MSIVVAKYFEDKIKNVAESFSFPHLKKESRFVKQKNIVGYISLTRQIF